MATATAEMKTNGTTENAPNSAPASQNGAPQGGAPAAPPSDSAQGGKRSNPLPLIIAAILVIAAGAYGVHYWQWSQTHVSTDNAYLTGNLVNVSPRVGGTLSIVNVAEGDSVKRGQLLARLDDASQQAALRQAQAAYDSAKTQIPQAESNVAFQKASTDAAIARAQAAIAAQKARTQGAGAQVGLTAATTRSQIAQAGSQVAQAEAQAAQVQANVTTARAQVASARQAVQTSERGVSALAARVSSAKADVEKASRDEARYSKLLTQEAVTQAQYDAVHAQAEAARSALAALQQQIAQAESQVSQSRVAVAQAQAQLVAAQKAAQASQAQVDVARAGLSLARANTGQVNIQESNLNATDVQNESAQADLAAAEAGNAQVALRKQQVISARADLARAAAALKTAQVNEHDTYLYSPSDGTIVRKSVNVGASLSASQTVLSMTEGNLLWVTANLKETQLANVRVGQPVEIDVDAMPDKKFEGIVASVNAATGASVSLLPPDNATGNFTKVVQRIPVKIAIVPSTKGGKWAGQEDFNRLRQGMSSVVVIDTADKTPHPEKVPANFDRLPENTGAATTASR